MNENQILIVRELLEYTRTLEQQLWGDEAEDAIVILAESMVILAEDDLMTEARYATPSRD